MNFKKLGALLAKRKILNIWTTEEGVQWVGDDISMYEMSGMPKFTTGALLWAFGVKPEKIDQWMTEEMDFPYGINTDMELQNDVPVSVDDNAIVLGSTFNLLHVKDKCFVIPERYLQPVSSSQMVLIFRTMPETGETKIIAREGMFVTGVFEPLRATEKMLDWLEQTTAAMKEE